MCLQMDFQLFSGLLVKIWGEFRRVRNWPILSQKLGCSPSFRRWRRIWLSLENRSRLSETPPMCLQMDFQLLSGLLVRVVYGLIVSHYVGSECEGARSVWAHGVSHVGSGCEESCGVWAHAVSHYVGSVWGIAWCMGSWSVPQCGEGVWGSARRMGSWNVPSRGVRVRDRVVYGLMKCPTMWRGSVRKRVVYGIMECPIMWRGSEVSRGVWAHEMSHYASKECERSLGVWAHAVSHYVGSPVWGSADMYGLIECPIMSDVQWGECDMYGLIECPIMSEVQCEGARDMYGLMECPIMSDVQCEGALICMGSWSVLLGKH